MLEAFRELYGDVTTSMSYKEFYDQCLVSLTKYLEKDGFAGSQVAYDSTLLLAAKTSKRLFGDLMVQDQDKVIEFPAIKVLEAIDECFRDSVRGAMEHLGIKEVTAEERTAILQATTSYALDISNWAANKLDIEPGGL